MSITAWKWIRSVILFLVVFGILKGSELGVRWLCSNYDALAEWAAANEKLSGWAQAVGATVGILIAIFVPAYQRYAQNLDRRREEAERGRTLALGCFYLLGDVRNYISRLIKLDNAPRNRAGDHLTVVTLLERIGSLELRETDWQRATMLYHARNFLLLAEGMTKVGTLEAVLDDGAREILIGYETYLTALQIEAKHDSSYRGQVLAKMNCHVFARAVFHLPKNQAKLPDVTG